MAEPGEKRLTIRGRVLDGDGYAVKLKPRRQVLMVATRRASGDGVGYQRTVLVFSGFSTAQPGRVAGQERRDCGIEGKDW